MNENEVSNIIIGCAIEVHKSLGPGLLESAYQEYLYYELIKSGLKVQKELSCPVLYKEIKLEYGYRIDLLIENLVIIELKAVEKLTANHKAQLLTYLKLGNYKLGLLINFNESTLKTGIKRIVKNLANFAPPLRPFRYVFKI
jgi:GxxExxY protein